MNYSDWYLDQLGITQYVLKSPNALKGEVTSEIDSHIRLIVVASQKPDCKLFLDILKAIGVAKSDCLHLIPSQLIMPIDQLKNVIWFIDNEMPVEWQNSELVNQKAIIQTQSLDVLGVSPLLKRQLWQELCQYENYFTA